MFDQCPDLGRAFPASASADVTRHVATCANCRAEWSRMEELAGLARSLPVAELPPERAGAVRDAMLAAAASRTRQKGVSPFASTGVRAALAMAASVVAIALFMRFWPSASQDDATPFRAQVVAGAAAQFTHQALPDETIRLVDGAVSLDVEPLRDGERLRVVTGDAEVEVRGTSFVVEAAGDKLTWVHVLRGRVEVRASGHAPVVLGALDHWRPAAPVALPSVTPVEMSAVQITPGPTRAAPLPSASIVAAVATPPIPLPADLEAPYRAAWDSFRRGDLDDAAAGFETVANANKNGALASDAAYWRAVALGRAGRSSDAIVALREYLRRFPQAPHAGEAHAMLGWLLLDSGERDAARRAFEQAIRSGSEAATTSGAEGLGALDQPEKPVP